MSHKHHSDRQRHHHGKHTQELPVSLAQRVPTSASEMLFTIDRKGDVQNLRYGSIDKYKVSKYRTAGRGRLLGLDRQYKVISSSATERQVDNQALDLSSKNHTFPLLLKRQTEDGPFLTRAAEEPTLDDFTEQQDYVSLGRKRRRLSKEEVGFKTGQREVPSTTGINGLYSDLTSESDVSSNDDRGGEIQPAAQDAFEVFKNHPDNKKQIELRNRTDRDPQNTNAWLEYIDHQERHLLLTSGDSKRAHNPSQIRAVTDIRVSLYEKAIRVVKDSKDKEKLLLGLMKEGAKIWDTNKQLKEWRAVLKSTKSIDFWYEFLNFQQTNTLMFSYETCLDTYTEMFTILSHLGAEHYDHHCSYLFLRLTTFMYEAGFSERSIAIWQALLEYNLLSPVKSGDSVQDFQNFWESECPRIGEKNARGWRDRVEQSLPPQSDTPLPQLDPDRLFSNWGQAETDRSVENALPARSMDETIEDDPYRVILFSDVKDFMFRIESENGKSVLVEAFLKFCGLPPSLFKTHQCRNWWSDPFLCDFTLKHKAGILTDTSTLFASEGSPFQVWDAFTGRTNVLLDHAIRTLTLITESPVGNDKLAEYVIALQFRKNLKSARQLAKSLTKVRSNSILLYNAYALVEASSGSKEVENTVWFKTVPLANSLGSQARSARAILFHSWMWNLVEQRNYEQALTILTKIVPLERPNKTDLQLGNGHSQIQSAKYLVADAYYRDQISNSLADGDSSIADFAALYCIFRYLRNDNDFQEVLQIYQDTFLLVNTRLPSHVVERLHLFRARHAHFHATVSKAAYRPVQLISLFKESLFAFPNISAFHGLYEQYLQYAGIVDRVHATSMESQPTPTITSLLHRISKEISAPPYAGSTVHSVRRAFGNATAVGSPARHCAALWLCWLSWEISILSELDTNQKQVKDIYLSALQACPWRKDLYLIGFTASLAGKFIKDNDLEQIYRSMGERGLRLRHDITDLLDE